MKTKHIVLLAILVLGIIAIAMVGAVPDKTYLDMSIPPSDTRLSVVSYRFGSETNWSISDLTADSGNWWKYDSNVNSSLYVDNGELCLKADFARPSSQYTVLFRPLNITVSESTVFSVNISVSEGVFYHVRFVGQDSAGDKREIWWETSPLDDIPGKGRWETQAVDLSSFSKRAIGEVVQNITGMQIIIDKPVSQVQGQKLLLVSSIAFIDLNLKTIEASGSEQFTSDNEPFQAVILGLPRQYELYGNWDLQWASVTYTLTSSSKIEYSMHLLSNYSGLHSIAQGTFFTSHESGSVDVYRLDKSSQMPILPAEELQNLMNLRGNLSILIIKNGFKPQGFVTFKLQSIELMYSRVNPTPDATNANAFLPTLVIAIAVILVPIVLLAVLNFPFKSFPNSRKVFFLLGGVFVYGCFIRLFLAPFSGHPYDMGVWTQSTRLYFESGLSAFHLYPMPVTYYLQLLSYAPYAVLRLFGFQDAFFLAHSTGMLESVFIKAPFILFDFFSVYLLYKIFNKLNIKQKNSNTKFAYALIYFLSPLAIILSSVWGIYDCIAVTFFLAGIYYGLLNDKPLVGALFFTISGLTEGFGFIGLIPLLAVSLKQRKFSTLPLMIGVVLAVAFVIYLPFISLNGIQSIPTIFMQFFKGRAGFGSEGAFIASDSYVSFLSLIGTRIESSYMTYLSALLFGIVTLIFALKVRKLNADAPKLKLVELSLLYFAAVFFIFYLAFFRVFDQFYLWVLPVLLALALLKDVPGPRLAASFLSIAATPVFLLGTITLGFEYYWVPLNLPADTSILAVVPSTIVVLAFLSLLDAKGPWGILQTSRGISVVAAITTWFTFGLAYYSYYGAPYLGAVWYVISFAALIGGAIFIARELGYLRNLKLKK